MQVLPNLDSREIAGTKNALHAYARVLGDWLKACRPKRKHWWHASLRPSLTGLTTGVIHAEIDFEISLNLYENIVSVRTSDGAELTEVFYGQSVSAFAQSIEVFLMNNGISNQSLPNRDNYADDDFPEFAAEHVYSMGSAINFVVAAMREFRAGFREESSPIQLWPHHFDLSLLWLPGELIAGQDPTNEEFADKQMNFGFTFGDEGIEEAYFYVTAYPSPDDLTQIQLPENVSWHTDGFNGALLKYHDLSGVSDSYKLLMDFWSRMVQGGRQTMLENSK